MKKILFFISLMLMNIAFADEVKIDINPAKPVKGEVFQAIFHVFTNSDEEPIINFSPFRVEVVGKNNYGIKTSTVWINGKFSSTREMTIVYDLAANTDGIAGLRDITIQLGPTVIRHPSVSFNILREPQVAADVFVMAEVPKKEIFLGEGIVVRYYLYSKVPVSNLDIKKYPKLNNFLKRFLQEPERSERVSVDGQIYIRTQLYGAKLFPEKVGALNIDPLHLTAAVLVNRGSDPFGSFGLNRETRQKTISSETVKVDVRPLPEDGKTPNFTGLIGKHEFELQLNSSRLIVNEPLELKLTITGGGALENMEAPSLLQHPDLEEFESNGDLKIQNADQATKVFDYTFLPKQNLSIPASTVTLTYFNPDTMKYVPVQLSLAEIKVAGGGQGEKKASKKEEIEQKIQSSPEIMKNAEALASPILQKMPTWKALFNYLNIILCLAALLIGTSFFVKIKTWPSLSKATIPGEFRKGHFNFGVFSRWMGPLISRTGKTPLSIIKESELSLATKTYFIDLLTSNDYKDYSHMKGQFKFVYKSESFKELDKYIQSATNEDTSRPS
jgi:hypothetical protein